MCQLNTGQRKAAQKAIDDINNQIFVLKKIWNEIDTDLGDEIEALDNNTDLIRKKLGV